MKYVYLFNEGNKDMKNLLGGKGANLAEMAGLNLPVPMGFTVTTEACNQYYENGQIISTEIQKEIFEKVKDLQNITHKILGDPTNPLLVSVRSGARASMPGMMDTVLNLGLNDEVAAEFSKVTGNPRFVYDSKSSFERVLDQIKEEKGVQFDTDLTAHDMIEITKKFKEIYKNLAGEEFPSDPKIQLMETIKAVFRSWMNERAIVYRKMNDIPSSWGTAVNVQEMVYGNLGENSGTGVAFTRNPATGENKLYGEYLMNAQGEDVVAGIRTPRSIETLMEIMPDVYHQFQEIAKTLEVHYKDMQDMEFTIENGKLFMLQTRNGKRTAQAALKIAVDLVSEGMLTKEETIMKVEPKSLDQFLHPMFEPKALEEGKIIAKGLAASPGAGAGKIYFHAADVIEAAKRGEKTILARLETSPEDIEGMNASEGILTIRGGMTSHAAVVARGMGRCCVCGCGELVMDEQEKTLTTKSGIIYHEGDFISLDGSTGCVYDGMIQMIEPCMSKDYETFMSWVDDIRTLQVRANADTPKDAKAAKKFGAEGIGLCRTEHMFFEEERIFHFRKMIASITEEQREQALEEILPYQREDFEKLFETMEGMPVIIRYLDPPLHEFLPHTDTEIKSLADDLDISFEMLKNRIIELKEFNPMMGHRGCRLAVTYPEIAKMQTRAVIEAALHVQAKGVKVVPEIMIPLIGDEKELQYVKNIVVQTAESILKEEKSSLKYMVGTMIEVPRAALLASSIAKESEFFSFGTNDLTQLTYGFSRDDAGKYLEEYYKKGIFENDPFAKVDISGVGQLIAMAVEAGRKIRPDIELGICGEHGGDAASIIFFDKVGLDYVSCSPYRVPAARLAAAQATILNQHN